MLRMARMEDAVQIAQIYNDYVDNTAITFVCQHRTAEDYQQILRDGKYPLLVAVSDDTVQGFVYASALRPHDAYRWDVEMTIYLRQEARGQGLGRQLMGACLRILHQQGYLNAYSCITWPNEGSVALHHAMGFVDIGRWPHVGYKLGQWHDVIWMQRTLGELPTHPQEIKRMSDFSPEAVEALLVANE